MLSLWCKTQGMLFPGALPKESIGEPASDNLNDKRYWHMDWGKH